MNMKDSDKSKTAIELLDDLKRNAEFMSQKEAREKEREKLEDLLRKEEKPILEDLSEIGLHIESVWDLVNYDKNYSDAILILAEHLQKPYHPRIKEGIARALTVKEAKSVVNNLIEEFKKESNNSLQGVKWAIANAISVVANDDVIDDIIELAKDENHGESREMLLFVLKKSKDKRSKNTLKNLLDDKQLSMHVRKLLDKN